MVGAPGSSNRSRTHQWDFTYAKAPVPRGSGDRALFLLVLRERFTRENGNQLDFLVRCRCNAPTSSCLPWSTWAYWDLSQSILCHPLSRWPFVHTSHRRLLRNPSGSITMSVRETERSLQSPKSPFEQAPCSFFRALHRHCHGQVCKSTAPCKESARGCPRAIAVSAWQSGIPTSTFDRYRLEPVVIHPVGPAPARRAASG